MKGKVFTAQEVQAIIAGTKTQFREVINPQPNDQQKHNHKTTFSQNKEEIGKVFLSNHNFADFLSRKVGEERIKCRYKVGQKIFSKEKFFEDLAYRKFAGFETKDGLLEINARYMKQEHARLFPLIKDIRVERLQDISKEDAIKEGMFFSDYGKKCYHEGYQDIKKCPSTVGHQNQEDGWNWKENKSPSECWGSAYWAFANYWNATHKKPQEKFEANPWVWVVEFENINK